MTGKDNTSRKLGDNTETYEETVRPDWIGYNGHMNVAYYLLVLGHGAGTA